MMKTIAYGLIGLLILAGGCAPTETSTASGTSSDGEGADTVAVDGGAAQVADATTPSEQVALTPENTTIQFVGIHSGDKPDPRTGTFGEFSGTATLQEGTLGALQVDIDTASLTTSIEKLTDHLRGPDFFNVREYPQATFVATSIEPGSEGGPATIVGDLTLLGVTKSISFPATISTEQGLQLDAEFPLDRTEFGMNYGTDKVEKEVTMTIKIDG